MKSTITTKVVARWLNLAMPASKETSVAVKVALGKLGEVTRKGWVLLEENLGDGYKSLKGGHVNLAHTPRLLGYIHDVEVDNGEIVASLSLSRRTLDDAGITPEEFLRRYAVSVEWLFYPESSYVEVNGQKLALMDALDKGYVEEREGALGNVEVVVKKDATEDIKIYPCDIRFTDLAILDRNYYPPNFPSARILAYANTTPIEATLKMVYDEIEKWAVESEVGGLVEEITTIPSTEGVQNGVANVLIGDKCFSFVYNTTTEGGVKLEMNTGGLSFTSLPYELDLAFLLGTGAAPSEKEGGHKTPPKRHKEEGATKRSQYADPTNWRYPLNTEAKARNALSRFGNPANRQGYSKEEQVFIAKRIVAACRRYGIKVDPDSAVGKLVGMKGESDVASNATAFCPQCKKVMEMSDPEETEVGGKKAIKGECPEGHAIYRFVSSLIVPEMVSALVDQALEGGLLGELGFTDNSGDGGDEDVDEKELEQIKSQAASEAIAKYESEVLPGKIEEALKAEREKAEAAAAAEKWLSEALNALNEISPLKDNEKEEFTKALSASDGNKEKELEVLKATRRAMVAEAKAKDLESRLRSSMSGVGPWMFSSSDKDGDKDEDKDEKFTL